MSGMRAGGGEVMSFGDLCSTDHLHYLMESCGQCGWQHPGLSPRPSEPAEGQRQAEQRAIKTAYEALIRTGIGHRESSRLSVALVPTMLAEWADAEARGHARGVAEAAARIEMLIRDVERFPAFDPRGYVSAPSLRALVDDLRRALGGDA